MAEFSAPFDGSPIATELQWSRNARQWGSDGVHTNDPASTALKVAGSGTTTVSVQPGMAFVNGFYYHLDAVKNLNVPANAGGTARVDLVVLRADQAANAVNAFYKTGGATPPPLTQAEDGVWEIPLAQCTVAAASTTVTAANVADRRYLTGRSVLPSIAGARPPSLKNQLLVEDGSLYVGDGATWRWIASQGVSDSTYTPVWTAGDSTINWGSGSQNIGRYQVSNKRVDLTIHLVPSGNPPAYDSPIEVSLPPGLPATSAVRSLFKWNYTSDNGEGSAIGVAMVFPTESLSKIARLRYSMTQGTSSTVVPNSFSMFTNQPFNIRTNDVLTIDGSYWLA
ncbi:hypothetical protein [Streptomyces sp. LUP47B]|uniref:hypothetical protein n=1 Tax=Streptomyces sp. LUP47B TaxID=1890286 RepID=UPI0008517DDD|nr:hypothetical protein [Streptomyces sp. LUP47B]